MIGKHVESGEKLQRELGLFKGNFFAKGILDSAWWALQSKVTGTPLHRLMGATRDVVPVGADFGVMDSVDDLLSQIGSAVADKFPRVKLKFRPGWDVPMLEAVRRQHPTHPIHIDCNSGYRLTDLDLFRRVDDFNLAMIEQPLQFDDLVDHAALQAQIRTPVCLDESLTSLRRAEQAAELKSCRYINIKPARVGGITNAIAIHNACQQAGIPCWVGGMLESATGVGICIALSMLDNFTYPADIFPSSRFYQEDMSSPAIELVRDAVGVPCVRAFDKLPEPVPERLAKLTVNRAVIGC